MKVDFINQDDACTKERVVRRRISYRQSPSKVPDQRKRALLSVR